ncbi:hypothetical protein H696_05862 [Fonticula alba]|uniref:Uncharacterized protein n=1 Tax=Fonticula alba TaxID=691883 RepID=A0A058Z101_FONAL|nr:hypothetical protein H696_05862 [Fonticula alba]KCV67598.1 hypothetical protein H696_05862 [Fonticula alba]|eukprot:XP_009497936.1 hypothetical protein H696_05862 [Fonticula alba]
MCGSSPRSPAARSPEVAGVVAAAGAAHELYDAECAGARLCRAIEAGEEPLPQGSDDVADFRLFRRLAGPPRASGPLVELGLAGRLLGLGRASGQSPLTHRGREVGIAPARRSRHAPLVTGPGPGHAGFEDLMDRARRGPPVLARLAGPGAPPPGVKDALLPEPWVARMEALRAASVAGGADGAGAPGGDDPHIDRRVL